MTQYEGRFLALTAPRRLRLDAIAIDTERLRPRDLLLEIAYSVLSPGTELAFYSGVQAEMFQREGHPLPYPTGLGLEVEPLLLHTIRTEAAASAYEGHLTSPDDHLGVVIDWTDERSAQE